MTEPSRILDRVRKLLALATSPNRHEAALAAARAQALIETHRLEGWLEDQAQTDADPIVDAGDTPLETARKIRRWKSVLANVLADVNGCVAYVAAHADGQAIVLVGRRRDRDAVAELWQWLVRRIEWLSATHGVGKPRAWHEAFRIGVVESVAEQLANVAEDVRTQLSPGALVRIDPVHLAHREALERFVREHLRLGKGRNPPLDGRAWRDGREASRDLGLADRRPPRRS